MTFSPAPNRYERMIYNRCGSSGLRLPAVSLGLWNNFGHDHPVDPMRAIVRRAFDLGITHFDLADNYGPPYGSAEENFGRLRGIRMSRWARSKSPAYMPRVDPQPSSVHPPRSKCDPTTPSSPEAPHYV